MIIKPLDEYSCREFKSCIITGAKDAENWYFSTSASAYYADYRPKYPEKTAGDFTVALEHARATARITIYQDTAPLPTIKQFSKMEDLLQLLRTMDY